MAGDKLLIFSYKEKEVKVVIFKLSFVAGVVVLLLSSCATNKLDCDGDMCFIQPQPQQQQQELITNKETEEEW